MTKKRLKHRSVKDLRQFRYSWKVRRWIQRIIVGFSKTLFLSVQIDNDSFLPEYLFLFFCLLYTSSSFLSFFFLLLTETYRMLESSPPEIAAWYVTIISVNPSRRGNSFNKCNMKMKHMPLSTAAPKKSFSNFSLILDVLRCSRSVSHLFIRTLGDSRRFH